jgi:hypothetical protein
MSDFCVPIDRSSVLPRGDYARSSVMSRGARRPVVVPSRSIVAFVSLAPNLFQEIERSDTISDDAIPEIASNA